MCVDDTTWFFRSISDLKSFLSGVTVYKVNINPTYDLFVVWRVRRHTVFCFEEYDDVRTLKELI